MGPKWKKDSTRARALREKTGRPGILAADGRHLVELGWRPSLSFILEGSDSCPVALTSG